MNDTAEKPCLLVTLTCQPGQRDALLERVRSHARACRAEEPGCLRFDVLVAPDDDVTVHLYEVYADDAAIAFHDATERMAQYREDVGPFLADRNRRVCRVVNYA